MYDLNAIRPTQHLEYLPFGELFIEERDSWNTPCKFSGKELDDETGYSYFGARYYDPNISIWLSVDPLSDEAPGLSAYTYCANNPIRLIDPNGMSIEVPDNKESRRDILSIVKGKNAQYIKYNSDNTMKLDFGTLSPKQISKTLKRDKGLGLLNDMINAENTDGSDQKYLYEATNNRKGILPNGTPFSTKIGRPNGTRTENDNSFATNLSDTPPGGDYPHVKPEVGYNGTVRISLGHTLDYNSASKTEVAVPRNRLVYHELHENFLRTNKGYDYQKAHISAGGHGTYTGFIWGK